MTSSNDNGFTLLEVLIATFLMALLSAMGVTLLNSSLQARDQLDQATRVVQSIELTRTMIRTDLAHLEVRAVKDAYGQIQPDVFSGAQGGRDAAPLMAFVANGRQRVDPETTLSSLQFVEYRLIDGRLVRRSRDRIDPTPDASWTERVLLEDVENLKIEFSDGRDWIDGWGELYGRFGGARAAPHAVSMTMTLKSYGDIPMVFLTSQVSS